jgi:hypothetical protein
VFGLFKKDPTKDEFAKRVLKRIADAGGPTDWVYDPVAFTIKRNSSSGFLHNTYESFLQAKGPQRERILDNFVAAFTKQTEPPPTFDEVRPKLFAAVRERALLAAVDGPGWGMEKAADSRKRPARVPISDWFARALVIDHPSHVAIVNEEQLVSWNVTFDEAFATGLSNLKDCTVAKFRQEGGYFVGTWSDDYDSSRILLADIFNDLPLKGDPVVCLPNRVTLMVTGADDPEAIRAMLIKAEEIVRTLARRQNPGPLIIRNGAISDYDVPAASPIYRDIQRARRIAALSYYEEQNRNLEQFYKKIGKDLFIASYTLSDRDGRYLSLGVWSRGIPTLLPLSDEIAFYDDTLPEAERIVARLPWSLVQAAFGDLMLDTKMFPIRYYVSGFPEAAQLRVERERLSGK